MQMRGAQGSTHEEPLWSVLQEHVDEGEFAVERFEAALVGPEYTLDETARGPEERLLAHVDALVLAGEPAVAKLLLPAFEAKKPPAGPRVVLMTLVLLSGARPELAAIPLRHPAPAVRRGAVRAWALATDRRFDDWMLRTLPTLPPSPERAAFLEAAVERELPVDGVVASALESPIADERIAALRAVRRGDPRAHERRIWELLEHPHGGVRDAALVTALHHGAPYAWGRCRELALDRSAPHPLAMTLLAGLGEPADHARLAGMIDSDAHRPSVLRSLGYSGNVALIPHLLSVLASQDEHAARLAGEALATVAGPEVDARVRKRAPAKADGTRLPRPEEDDEARRSLPRFEHDDLDADLVPGPERGLPKLDAEALAVWWRGAEGRFDSGRRYLQGEPATRGAFARALVALPMRRRYLLSLLLSVRTAGAARVATRAFSARQRRQIAEVAAMGDGPWERGVTFFI